VGIHYTAGATSCNYSRIQLNRDRQTISGTTTNVALLRLALDQFGANKPVNVALDGQTALAYTTRNAHDTLTIRKNDGKWVVSERPSLAQKGPHRYGTFKDAFTNQMVFVYGTKGSKEENDWNLQKARYDAETWYYRGNGAVDIIPDVAYNSVAYANRGVILFGNATNNAAWKLLLADCPIQVDRQQIRVGSQQWTGDDLGAYFVWPIRGVRSGVGGRYYRYRLERDAGGQRQPVFCGCQRIPRLHDFRARYGEARQQRRAHGGLLRQRLEAKRQALCIESVRGGFHHQPR